MKHLLLVGINHRTAPVEVRERMAIEESRLAATVADLVRRDGIEEGMILATCNRVELTVRAAGPEPERTIRQFLAEYHHCDLAPYEPYLYWRRQEEVVRHLFRVASSLDSMIVGEPQILGQVKQAYATARAAGGLTGVLNDVVNQALAVARRVRRETALGALAVSVSYAAIELAKKIFGSLRGKCVFLIGAGKMSELAAKHLLRSGASTILVSNRTYERAVELAAAFRGKPVHFEALFDHLNQADIVISSTGAAHFIIGKDQAERLMAARRNRPIFFVDIAVPRDIDPAVNDLDNAFVYDIDDLEHVVDANRQQREREAAWAEQIVNDEVAKMMRRLASREVVPTIVALEGRIDQICQMEMNRFRSRLGSLTTEQRETVEALIHGVVNKILHGPITELKSGAGQPEQGALVQTIRKIFGVSE
jgi:glutamyl-tRNA reductase